MTAKQPRKEDYPVVLMQDRYDGVYSGGAWLAIADASELVDGTMTRSDFCLTDGRGPHGNDLSAGRFWSERPDWIASGASPMEALAALNGRAGTDTQFKHGMTGRARTSRQTP